MKYDLKQQTWAIYAHAYAILKGKFWHILFKITPSLWICGGCNDWLHGIRGWWGKYVTQMYGYYGNDE